jgi:hypothetical protein
MTPPPSLERVQRWMLSVITHPLGVEAGLVGPQAQSELKVAPTNVEAVIERSHACTSVERLAVYSHAYFARLLECLEAEFDVVAKAAGRDPFASLAAGYLQSYPPSSYTLGQLGAHFPRYLEETRPPRTATEASPDWADVLIDVARLERLYAEVFDGPGHEATQPLDASDLGQVPPGDWPRLRLQITPSLRLLSLRFPAHDYFAALRRTDDAPPPEPRNVTLAVSRRNFVVERREVTPLQATLLTAMQSGLSLGDALEAALSQHETPARDLLAQLEHWFRDWTAAGLIIGLEPPANPPASAP